MNTFNNTDPLEKRVSAREMSEQEAIAAFGEEESFEGVAEAEGKSVEGNPDWAPPLPPGLKIPLGVQVSWLRIRAAWTVAPHKGDRVCAVWPLDEIEERQSVTRARGDQYRMLSELSKSCVRTVDAFAADRTGSTSVPGSLDRFWREIGPKGRSLVRTYYSRTHTMTDEESQDFFLNCFATRTAAPG